MSLDLRPLTTNASQHTLHEILEDHAIRAEILWSFIVLLHFAALLPLNPVIVHVFVVLLNWATEKARPVLEQRAYTCSSVVAGWLALRSLLTLLLAFYDGVSQRLNLDSSVGVRGL